MYITASWVQAPNKDLGTNIRVHPGFSPEATPDAPLTAKEAERVAAHPGKVDRDRARIELPPRMNRVLAYIDIVLDEGRTNMDSDLPRALEQHDPAKDGWSVHGGVAVQFFIQPNLSARKDTYEMLRAQLLGWLGEQRKAPLAQAG